MIKIAVVFWIRILSCSDGHFELQSLETRRDRIWGAF
jgi:hypothetical protein